VGIPADVLAGHSLRSGLATTAARNGASEASIMRRTGHRSDRPPAISVRDHCSTTTQGRHWDCRQQAPFSQQTLRVPRLKVHRPAPPLGQPRTLRAAVASETPVRLKAARVCSRVTRRLGARAVDCRSQGRFSFLISQKPTSGPRHLCRLERNKDPRGGDIQLVRNQNGSVSFPFFVKDRSASMSPDVSWDEHTELRRAPDRSGIKTNKISIVSGR
jgi:hypothetical protein